MKVLVSYRVMQSWRLPLFKMISESPSIDLLVLTSKDFKGTKVVNAKPTTKINFWKKIYSFNIFLRRSSGNFCLPIAPMLLFHIIKFKPEIIIVEGISNIFNNFQCFIYAKLFNVPIIQWGLGELPNRRRGFMSKLIKNLLTFYERQSDAAIAYSTSGKEYYLKAGFPKHKVITALNVIDTNKRKEEIFSFLESNNFNASEKVPNKRSLIYLGAIEKNKDLDYLIDLHQRLLADFPELNLEIVGDGSFRKEIENECIQENKRNIIFHGNKEGEIANILCGSSLLVLPSLGGLVFSEALIHGVPIMCGPADGSEKDFTKHQKSLLMTNKLKEDQEKWYEVAKNYLLDEKSRRSIIINGCEFIKANDINSYAGKIEDFCKFIFNDHKKHASFS